MKAAVYTHYGNPDNLRLADVEKPQPRGGEVLVRVAAASINSWDWDMLKGKQLLVRMIGGLRQPKHQVLGADIAGHVEAIGTNVDSFKPGDEVFGDIAGRGFGGFAEYVAVPEKLLAFKPANISFQQAAALPQAGLLALQGLQHKGRIKPGDKILINGAGGGVGTLALQYAKLLGAEVTCVDLPEKFDTLRTLGADHLIDYTTTDYTRTGQQYHRILDVIAHRTIADYKRALNPGGTFTMIGGSMGGLLLQLMLAGNIISALGNKTLGLMGYRPNRDDLDYLGRLSSQGQLQPVIDRVYPLSQTPEAFHYFGTGRVQGKILIVPDAYV